MENQPTTPVAPFIKSLSIWNSINSSVSIDCGDGTTATIEIPTDATKDLSVDDKYNLLKEKAERYMKCITPHC